MTTHQSMIFLYANRKKIASVSNRKNIVMKKNFITMKLGKHSDEIPKT